MRESKGRETSSLMLIRQWGGQTKFVFDEKKNLKLFFRVPFRCRRQRLCLRLRGGERWVCLKRRSIATFLYSLKVLSKVVPPNREREREKESVCVWLVEVILGKTK